METPERTSRGTEKAVVERASIAGVALVIAVVAVLNLAKNAQGDAPSEDRKTLLQQQREQYENGVNLLPPLDEKTHALNDLFQLKLRNGRLNIVPGIPSTAMRMTHRVQVEGVPSPATIAYVASWGRRRRDGVYAV